MKLVNYYSHHYGKEEWEKRDMFSWVISIFDEPNLNIRLSNTRDIHQHFREHLTKRGWSNAAKISVDSNLTVYSLYTDLALQVQTGNICRYSYDLLKIQYLYQSEKINAAALVLPTKEAAKNMGDNNLATSERVWNELRIFSRVITVPILILAFE